MIKAAEREIADNNVISALPSNVIVFEGAVAHGANAVCGGDVVRGTENPVSLAADEAEGMGAAEPDAETAAAASRLRAGRWGYRIAKRAFDIVFSAGVCVVLAIPVAVACAAVSLDSPGAPFFRQERVGRDGKSIYIFKIRSMYSDAHEHPEHYLDEVKLAQWKREQKVDCDPRVTRVGRAIRKTSLDELPQFLNVLTGDMSVIGPRPVTLEETYEFGDDRDEVLSVRPGITGLWQSTDRNEATWANGRRQKLELEYVLKQGFAMDCKCFIRTFGAMFGKNKTGR